MIAQSVGLLVVILSLFNLARMALFLIGSDIYYVRDHLQRRRRTVPARLPHFTVIVPAHNEEKTIATCIRSVIHNGYPRNLLQVIVVDDGSDDRTVAVSSTFKSVLVVPRPHRGKAEALNSVLRTVAQGEFVMCLDADSTVAPGALRAVVRHFDDPRVAAVASNVKIRDDGSLLALIQKFEYIVCYQMKRAQTLFNVEYIIGGIGSTFRRSMIERVGYYDTNTVTEDIDLTMKLLQLGTKRTRVIYGADVVTETEPVTSIGGLIRQRYRWKYGRCQTFFKNLNLFFSFDRSHSKFLTWGYLPYAIVGDLLFFLEPLIVGYIFYIILWYRDLWTLVVAVSVITAYIAINILGEETISWRKKVPLLLLAPLMYFLFYVLSFVEYVALIKSLIHFHNIPRSIRQHQQRWTHVERSAANLGLR